MLDELGTYDWEQAFGYTGRQGEWWGDIQVRSALPSLSLNLSSFTREDVAEIAGMSEGEKDYTSWLVYGRLKDDRWFFLSAGCGFTGWEAGGVRVVTIARSREELERFGMGDGDRERLGVSL